MRFVFPALLLNYFGQGALLLAHPGAIQNPFFLLAPSWALLYPLVVLASTATVTRLGRRSYRGAFSITRQARCSWAICSRMLVRHTSERAKSGQVYVPAMNGMLLVAVVATVIGFRSSDALGGARYGIAVTGTMTVTTVLALLSIFAGGSGWSLVWRLVPLFVLFLVVDLSFFGANLLKIIDGGWFLAGNRRVDLRRHDHLAMGLGNGSAVQARQRRPAARHLGRQPEARSSGARAGHLAIYMTARVDNVPAALPVHNMKHNKILHERNVLMTVRTEDVPRLPEAERLQIDHLSQNFHTVTIHYGFLEEPDIPRALALCRVGGFRFNLMETFALCRPRKDRRQRPLGSVAAVQKTVRPVDQRGARRHRVFSHPGQPHRRARRPGRALAPQMQPRPALKGPAGEQAQPAGRRSWNGMACDRMGRMPVL